MSRTGIVKYTQLRSSLVNLPQSIVGTLSQRNILPQSLVVQLTPRGKDRHPLFVGWTGLASSAAFGNADNVELDASTASDHGLGDGEHVTITLHRSIPSAKSVSVDPLSADDWEILESNAGLLEETLLSQVRAVKPGTTVAVWAAKNVRCRFTVGSVEPPSSSITNVSRLVHSTEIHISPRLRAATSGDLLGVAKDDELRQEDIEKNIKTISRQLHRLVIVKPDLRLFSNSLCPIILKGLENDLSQERDENLVIINNQFFKEFIKAFPSQEAAIVIKPRKRNKSSDPLSDLSASQPTVDRINSYNYNTTSPAPSKPVPEPEEWEAPGIAVKVKGNPHVPVWHMLFKPKNSSEWPMWIGQRDDTEFELARFVTIKHNPKPNPQWKKEKEEAVHFNPSLRVAGVDKQRKQCTQHVVVSTIERRMCYEGWKVDKTYGILLTGPSGSGKTTFALSFANEMAKDLRTLTYTKHVDLSSYTEERMSTLRKNIIHWFEEAIWHSPSLLILDGLDKLCPAELEHADKTRTQTLSQVLLYYAEKAVRHRAVVLLVTAESPNSLNKSLSSSSLWRTKVSLAGLDRNNRKEVIAALLEHKVATTKRLSTVDHLDMARLVELTEGYLPSDLRDIINRSVHECALRSVKERNDDMQLGIEDFESALKGFIPVSLKNVKLQKSDIQWEDIGGLRETKAIVRETLEFPTKYARIFAQSPLRLRSGLLLYGYPGCGKTLLASAVAKECGLNFISVKGPELLNKYIGQSEASVRELFDRAAAAKPCVLFFDEFDSIAPKRGHDSTGVTDRVVNQMLTQMDGAEGLEGVYVLAATSRPDLIDPALLRPGRLDKSIICNMPDLEDRLDILRACSRKLKFTDNVDLSQYASQTAGFSGADLQAFIYNAHLDAIQSSLLDKSNNKREQDGYDIRFEIFGGLAADHKSMTRQEKAKLAERVACVVQSSNATEHVQQLTNGVVVEKPVHFISPLNLTRALSTTRPSVPKDEIRRLQKITKRPGRYDQFLSGRNEGGLPSGEASTEIGGRSSLM